MAPMTKTMGLSSGIRLVMLTRSPCTDSKILEHPVGRWSVMGFLMTFNEYRQMPNLHTRPVFSLRQPLEQYNGC